MLIHVVCFITGQHIVATYPIGISVDMAFSLSEILGLMANPAGGRDMLGFKDMLSTLKSERDHYRTQRLQICRESTQVLQVLYLVVCFY